MYYNSNKNNSAYYNAYKEEMETLEDYHDEFSFQKIMKIGFIILALGLLSILTIYLSNYFATTKKEPIMTQSVQLTIEEKIPKVLFSKDTLPKSIQLQESTIQSHKEIKLNSTDTEILAKIKTTNENRDIEKSAEVSPKDVALIVKIILSQMNHKKEIPLEKQLLSAEENTVNTKTLKESNHYNKVILSSSKNRKSIDKQIQFRKDLDWALLSTKKISSSYEQAIKKEIDVRSNEMRIIIVKKGDTLSKIAKKAYGSIDAYPKIFMANPEIIKNPNEIFVGQRLRIPA